MGILIPVLIVTAVVLGAVLALLTFLEKDVNRSEK